MAKRFTKKEDAIILKLLKENGFNQSKTARFIVKENLINGHSYHGIQGRASRLQRKIANRRIKKTEITKPPKKSKLPLFSEEIFTPTFTQGKNGFTFELHNIKKAVLSNNTLTLHF